MQLEAQKFLYDINESIDSINQYLTDKRDFNIYQNDKLLRRGIERELEIIGEAVNKLLKIDPTLKIDNARKIVDLRNWVIHGYDKIDDVVIWGIVSRQIPLLKKQVEELLF
ncbi:MAG: hypothetical protein FD181_3451 [Prolixibacteraceae bacterium]|nr:MAG: hypothetical protein FD181_3451 [Prolixibacteraceae bacterium]